MPFDPDQPRDDNGMWTSGDAGDAIKKAASDKKGELTKEEKRDAEENDYKEPIATRTLFENPFYDNKYYKQEAGYYHNNKNKAIVQDISINDISPTQLTIDGAFKNTSNVLPVLVRNKDGIHVLDGHHRIGKSILNGAKTIKANVIEYNTN